MTEYSVLFAMKLSAKNVKDLERKSETVAENISKHLKKKVYPHSYGELVKKDIVEDRVEEKLC